MLLGLGIYTAGKTKVTRSDGPTVKVITIGAISNDEVKNIKSDGCVGFTHSQRKRLQHVDDL